MYTHCFRLFYIFFLFCQERHSKLFFLAPSQFLLFSLEGAIKSDLIKDLYWLPTTVIILHVYLIFIISEIAEDKNHSSLSQQCSTHSCLCPLFAWFFYIFTSMGFLLVFRAPNGTVTSSTFDHGHKTCAGFK